MRALYKYVITPAGKTEMPSCAEVLSVGAQGEEIVCWALVRTDFALVTRRLIPVPTGARWEDDELGPSRAKFIGTVQRPDGSVFHIFDGGAR